MIAKAEYILNEALSLSPAERATIAHCLISSIDEPAKEDVEHEWMKLVHKRLSELENNEVKPVSWNELKQRVRASCNA